LKREKLASQISGILTIPALIVGIPVVLLIGRSVVSGAIRGDIPLLESVVEILFLAVCGSLFFLMLARRWVAREATGGNFLRAFLLVDYIEGLRRRARREKAREE